MSNPVIQVEGLSKSYLLRHEHQERYIALRDVITNNVRGFFKNVFSQNTNINKDLEEFWALQDVSFEIQQGDRVGVIGRNGAGKSTLLKILSRITEPTKGEVSIKGRVASLLEVGTGFHPELTGRENVFLNGAILGMSRTEIKSKFDEIVAFAEVEKFLDTPVKRYSSGMYVRLAFAVAAHLEPEILIVDEVLAVGDAQFQKKCLGKMEDVSKNEGRTVLFVSHSMPTITSLCNKGILLEKGKTKYIGSTSEAVMQYYNSGVASPTYITYKDQTQRPGDNYVKLLAAGILINERIAEVEIDIRQEMTLFLEFEIIDKSSLTFNPFFYLLMADGTTVLVANASLDQNTCKEVGIYKVKVTIPANYLNEGTYFINMGVNSLSSGVQVHFYEQNLLSFNVKDPIDDVPTRLVGYSGIIPGVVRPLLNWTTHKI
jgi:lipopolysaccharide transport system ATP-binding protein